jgi:TnpA family transposase
MPARTLLSPEQRTRLFSTPADPAEMVRHYTLGADDFALIRTKRRSVNRIGFAAQLCLLRYPGFGGTVSWLGVCSGDGITLWLIFTWVYV